jgi:hypothetical protein
MQAVQKSIKVLPEYKKINAGSTKANKSTVRNRKNEYRQYKSQ